MAKSKKEVSDMLEWIANLCLRYGFIGAGIPSHHGLFEAQVPEQLRKARK